MEAQLLGREARVLAAATHVLGPRAPTAPSRRAALVMFCSLPITSRIGSDSTSR